MVIRFRVRTNHPLERLNLHVTLVSPLPKSYRDTFNDSNCRYKARLVANGSTQLEGVDVDKTFSLVVKPSTIWIVLILATSRHWPVHHLNIKNAFLHGDLFETVYMHQPLGFRDYSHPDYGTDIVYLLLYVDDIALTASSEKLLKHVIGWLHQEFSMIDLGSFNYFLGISVTRDSLGMFLSQKKYAVEILDSAHMVNCNYSRTPVDTESKHGGDGDPVSDPTLYRSLAGSLQYLTFTRLDISYVVHKVCLYMHDPREPHLSALKRILRYVCDTLDYGLQLFSSSTTNLVAYSDANCAGCPTTRHLTSGYSMFLGNNLLSCSSKHQPTLSRSSAEAEYHGVANAVTNTCWLSNLLRELHSPLSFATLVYCDNVSAVYLSCTPVQHQRTKHIEIDIHFVRDLVAAGQVRVLHVPSRYQFADIFTKGLPSALFEEFRSSFERPVSSRSNCGGVLVATISCWTVMGKTDLYLGGTARSRVCSHRGSDTLLSGFAHLIGSGLIIKNAGLDRIYNKNAKEILTLRAEAPMLGCLCYQITYLDGLNFKDVSNICEVPHHQEVFVDSAHEKSLIVEILELKDLVADNGSATWFLQDLAIGQNAEGTIITFFSFRVPYNLF
ncbi:ribonuclease H-like domain-containing protein [Tanacetum coccineum]